MGLDLSMYHDLCVAQGVDAAFIRTKDVAAWSPAKPGGCACDPQVDWLDGQSFPVAATVAGGVLTMDKTVTGVFEVRFQLT